MLEYVILDARGIVSNIIRCTERFAEKIGAMPAYAGAAIGTKYTPPAVTPTTQEANVWDELDAAYQEGVDSV